MFGTQSHPRIDQYQLVRASSPAELSKQINDYIVDGYQPYCEPFIDPHNTAYRYCQAVVRYEN